MDRLIIDVRESYEYESGHVPEAVNIPPAELMSGAPGLHDVPKETQLILYCRTGSRSEVAKRILQNMGYTNVVNGINKDHVEAKYL